MNKQTNEQKYIIRCDRAGVFYAEIESRDGSEAVLRNARRIHYWTGAASLSQLAVDGCRHGSRITRPVETMTVLGVIEIIPCAAKAVGTIEALPAWTV